MLASFFSAFLSPRRSLLMCEGSSFMLSASALFEVFVKFIKKSSFSKNCTVLTSSPTIPYKGIKRQLFCHNLCHSICQCQIFNIDAFFSEFDYNQIIENQVEFTVQKGKKGEAIFAHRQVQAANLFQAPSGAQDCRSPPPLMQSTARELHLARTY